MFFNTGTMGMRRHRAAKTCHGTEKQGWGMVEIEAVVGQAVPAISAAIGAYGVGVLTRAEDDAAEATVRLGQRVLGRILRRVPDRSPVEAAVGVLADAMDDPDALAALRSQVRNLLRRDSELLAELTTLLPTPPAASAPDGRGIAVSGGSVAIASTGDNAVNVTLR
ncbi:hypothetical protein [Catenulispora yoronensis]